MLKSILTPALVALSLAGVANAAEPASNSQLAAYAGVADGQYSAAELQSIITAKADGNTSALNYYLSGANRSSENVNDASGQLAAQAGVESGKYTAAELSLILNSSKEYDRDRVAFIVSGDSRATSAAAENVSAGEAQLASALGVNPADYTLAQLIAMTADAN